MKFNEKTLLKYASSLNSEVDKSGWLLKKSESKLEFQRRFCVLKGNLLFYFEKKTDKEPLGCIMLEGCRIELEDSEQQLFSFKIVFSPITFKNYIFSTDSQASLESWMQALASCSIGFLKMILAELQKQVEDLEKEANSQDILNIMDNKLNMKDDEETLISINGDRGSFELAIQQNEKQKIIFSKIPFVEIHQRYGFQFLEFFNKQKNKKTSIDDLLLF